MRRTALRRSAVAGLLSAALLAAPVLAGCTSAETELDGVATGGAAPELDDPELEVAESDPVEDSVYPEVGDPGVDALTYDLDLAWDPDTETLTAVETVAFRSTEDDDDVQLDLSSTLTVSSVQLDGDEVDHEQSGKDLVVRAEVEEDQRYTLRIAYSGTPSPVPAPTTRPDFNTVGWNVTDTGETWTMQEPYGAYSWYAVNDHPSDKALYTFTISAPSPYVGVANGKLVERTEADGITTTRWDLDAPAASYLVTMAIGEFRVDTDESAGGVPITYWTAPEDRAGRRSLRVTPDALDWLEELLGPYPFETLGLVLVDSQSGMETQTMITLGRTEYTTSARVIVHELVHQWYGDLVTPTDWTALWMNEGMAMYLQGVWMVEFTPGFPGQTLDDLMDEWANFEPQMRRESGPPAAYDPAEFGEGNAYYGPALMWHELRKRIGDETFWALVREWPQVYAEGNATAEQFIDWLNERTGRDLTAFYDSWLYGETSPRRR